MKPQQRPQTLPSSATEVIVRTVTEATAGACADAELTAFGFGARPMRVA